MKRGNIARLFLVFRNAMVASLGLTAFADGEPSVDEPANEPPAQSTQLNYEDLIRRARKEEKEKHYKTIEKLKSDLKVMTKSNNDNLLKVADLEGKLDSLNTKLTSTNTGDSEAVKTLKGELETAKANLEKAEKELKTLKETTVDEEALRAEIKKEFEDEYEVKNYRAEILAKNNDILVPELVFGGTKEEIDNSLKLAKERSDEIRKSIGVTADTNSTVNQSAFSNRMPAISSPSASSSQAKVTFEDLAGLNPASPEYADMRRQLGLR